jgi:GTP diphosphokinase / guanosine-3',5'-bis(diphosphate) 3'-diphosphatase
MEMNNELFEKALIFAAKKHKGQKRKGNKLPYIIHPMGVAAILLEAKESKNILLLLIVCLLHDYVEDCDEHLTQAVKLAKIAKLFGHQVAALVEELTLDKDKYETVGKTQLLCNEVLKMSSYALAIKLADRLYNVRDTKSMPETFRDKYFAETKTVIATLEENRKLTKSQLYLVNKIKDVIK